LSLTRFGLSLADIERLDNETDIRDKRAIESEVERLRRIERLVNKIDMMDAFSIAVARGMRGVDADREFQKQRKTWVKELRELEGIKDESGSWLLKNRRSRRA
jgi:hypothetical protein